MKEAAVDHYKSPQVNCAQSVALAWKDKKDPLSQHSEAFASVGGGRAPNGLCGALHAARELAPHACDMIEEQFKKKTNGYTTCKDIRRSKIMPCNECVALAAGLLEEERL